MDVLVSMVEHHIWVAGEVLTRADNLSDDQLNQPIELDDLDGGEPIRWITSHG